MRFISAFFSKLFRRKSAWDSMDFGKPARMEDEAARLNGER